MKHVIVVIFLVFAVNGIYAQNEIKMENNEYKKCTTRR